MKNIDDWLVKHSDKEVHCFKPYNYCFVWKQDDGLFYGSSLFQIYMKGQEAEIECYGKLKRYQSRPEVLWEYSRGGDFALPYDIRLFLKMEEIANEHDDAPR